MRTGQLVSSLVVLTVLIFPVILAPNVQPAQQSEFHEYQVKAAFLYNFAKFVDWPKEALEKPETPVIIGIMGDDPFGSDLDETLETKTAQGRPLKVKRLMNANESKNCHILFICLSQENRLAESLSKVNKLPILTVSDIEGFSRRGGMVTFITEGNKVRFEINADAVQEGGLRISSQLLKLATIVHKEK